MLRDDGSMMHEQMPFSSSSNIEYDRCELVLAMPVTVGDFTVDTSMQMRIRDQLVIEEMRSVEIVIHQFAARLQEAQCSSPADPRDSELNSERSASIPGEHDTRANELMIICGCGPLAKQKTRLRRLINGD
jgi:hypothetical protein